eukprot:3391722-Lingulodinium_polyedra.AAC.1
MQSCSVKLCMPDNSTLPIHGQNRLYLKQFKNCIHDHSQPRQVEVLAGTALGHLTPPAGAWGLK